MRPINIKKAIIALLIPEAVGGLAALLSGNISETYMAWKQPPLAPPGIVFPIVWAILYALMGIASYLVFDERKVPMQKRKKALTVYAVQLFINFIWPIIFFGFKSPTIALVIIIALVIAAILATLQFRHISQTAFVLMIPYIVWLFFATYLNIGIVALN